ncbi:benzoate 4-monooxygenase cytochrome P450 [Aspergillus heteromorphus CBS 117.55]|uniref:Benzoate 4-monooxygenase cytochrome P450 n=1 Tax=Aspergillus heteromorphus CBS 117.55 TaxID=1448321 RepID=A0A317VA87_9EURO|nr:benzoate 4-monooxygenase cytochrome P450 [Aspergillus heteromorphus CBS 117.55]PWY70995.1 benzoate 4-monooxygenase cytochrome P450 [Aspergillus heteromorphus CBS 117.55]
MAMADPQSPVFATAAFCIGVALHVFVFRIGEWDLAATRVLAAFASAALLVVVVVKTLLLDSPDSSLWTALRVVSWPSVCLVAGVETSMLVYRAFFHRLHHFPGPFWARLSSIYSTLLSAKDLHMYEEVEKLHNTYGDFVRVGPTELSINHPDAISAISSSQSPCTKGPFYTLLEPRNSMHMTRDPVEHAQRRKVWERGFTSKALRDYEPRVARYADQLLAHIDETQGKPINVSDWFSFYSFDVLGDLAFGKSFDMLQTGTKHYFMTSLHADMTNVGVLGHLPWIFPIFKATPVLNYEHKRFWRWVDEQVEGRKKITPAQPDVFECLLSHHNAQGSPSLEAELKLTGDAYLIVVAGSDTTSASLITLFYQLASDRRVLAALQDEVDTYFQTIESLDYQGLSKLTYLEAVINETMRLHPPVPSGVQRMTPPEGLWIDKTWIPGDTIVQVPSHTLFRDERLFLQPHDFIPERWTTRQDLIRDSSAFVPFSTGKHACIGKQLGLMEIRYVVSQIVRKYDVEFAPGQTPERFLAGKRDAFTLSLGPLELVFKPRKEEL